MKGLGGAGRPGAAVFISIRKINPHLPIGGTGGFGGNGSGGGVGLGGVGLGGDGVSGIFVLFRESFLLQRLVVNLIHANEAANKVPIFLGRKTASTRRPDQLAR